MANVTDDWRLKMERSLVDFCSRALRTNLGVRAEERVVIVHDGTRRHIVEAFGEAALGLASQVELHQTALHTLNGQEPSADVAQLMLEADVALLLLEKSISWTRARVDATASGTRIASMPGITSEIIKRTFGADYRRIRARVNRLCDLLDEARQIRLYGSNGSILEIGVDGRQGRGRKGGIYDEPGAWGNLPCGEAFIAPVEETSTGKYVVDASHAGVGRVEEPIVFDVEEGCVTKISGGREAAKLIKTLEGVGDPLAFNLAEFGIGCHPGAKIRGTTLEDEKSLGTCHLALGRNLPFGGTTDVGIHLDGVIRKPTVFLDKRLVLEEGIPLFE